MNRDTELNLYKKIELLIEERNLYKKLYQEAIETFKTLVNQNTINKEYVNAMIDKMLKVIE